MWKKITNLMGPVNPSGLRVISKLGDGHHLNSLLSPGVYRVNGYPYMHKAQGYPVDSFAGTVVVAGGESAWYQEVQHFATRKIYRRFKWASNDWSPWVEIMTQPVGGGRSLLCATTSEHWGLVA